MSVSAREWWWWSVMDWRDCLMNLSKGQNHNKKVGSGGGRNVWISVFPKRRKSNKVLTVAEEKIHNKKKIQIRSLRVCAGSYRFVHCHIIFGARAAAAEKEKENMNPAWLKVLSPSWRLSLLGQLYYLLEGTPCLTWIEDDVQEEKLLLVGCMVPYCDVYIHIIHLVNWYEFFKLLKWFLLDNYNTVSTGVCARTTRNQNQYNATTRLELTRPNPLLIFIIV